MIKYSLYLSMATGLSLCLSTPLSAQKKSQSNKDTAILQDERISNDGLTILYGNALIEKLQEEGSFETYMQLADTSKKIQYRSCAYVGDQVNFRIRASRFGLHLKYLLQQWQADRVLMAFGGNESYSGAAGLSAFETELENYVKLIQSRHANAELVLISPIAAEKDSAILELNVEQRNADIKLYTEAMQKIAKQYEIKFIDLFAPTQKLFASTDGVYTVNTQNLSDKGSHAVGRLLAEALEGQANVASIDPESNGFKSVQKLVQRKVLEVAQAYHPANGISYYGLRSRSYEYNTEIPHYLKLANILDQAIWKQAAEPAKKMAFPELPIYRLTDIPAKAPKRGLGKIKTSEQDLKDFKLAPGYEINCFASSEEFPELINPLQIQFDARGRLWVSCFASYPHPLPGMVSNDTILIFEDTDGDGKADKKFTFADGLNLPDGFVFYKDGIVVSTATKLIYLEDTDGDNVADINTEVLRGFDNTDTHHSGYLQRSPHGDIIMSEALFHRGQFETLRGVIHTKDTSIMSFDMDTRKITVERQTEAPNPWKVTFNKWGESIQFYGGGQIIDADIHNVATPMGGSAPMELGMPFRYDKGCSAAFVDSPHFPQSWQGGLLTTHLLSTNQVNYTPLKLVNGAYKAAGKKTTLVNSSNKSFRPTDVVFGDDGALYVSDFYYPIIGHAQHSIRDKNRDYANGRIWKVTKKGEALIKPVSLEGKEATALINELKNPFLTHRQNVRIELEKLPKKAVNTATANALKSQEGDNVYALELLWLMERQKNFTDTSLIKRLVASDNINVRRAAVRSLRWWADALSTELEPILTKLASDPDQRVKMGVVTVISHLQLKDEKWSSIGDKITAKANTPLAIMKQMLTWKDRPGLAAEFPILEISKKAYIPDSLWVKDKIKKYGYFYFNSEQDGTLNIGHSGNAYLNITINDTPILIASGGPHSKESQNAFTVKKGINKVEFSILNKGQFAKKAKTGFKLYIADKAGNPPSTMELPQNGNQLKEWQTTYENNQKANWKEYALTTFKQNCANCHNVDTKAVGPALAGLFGKKQTVIKQDGSKEKITVDKDYIRRAIINPLVEYPAGFQPIMVKLPLSDKEVDALVKWIVQLK